MFERFSRVVGQFEVGEVIGWIREGRYRAEVEAIRAAIDSGDKKRAEGLKKGLPGVTFSACFEGGRLMRYLVRYNRLIVLDLDGVEVAKVAGMVRQEEYTLACFRSTGGRGLKILVRVDGEKEQHKAAFQLVADYYERLLGVVVDRSGKDITRLCFLSWDEAAYCNPEARIFEVKTGDRGQEELKMEKEEAIDELEAMLAYTQRKQAYQNGNRNNFLYQFAANCNRVGLNWKVVMDYCKANVDLGVSEIESKRNLEQR